MKIKTLNDDSKSPKGAVRIEFVNAKAHRFIERGDGSLVFACAIADKPYTLRTLRTAIRKLAEDLRRHAVTSIVITDARTLAGELDISDEMLGELFAYNLTIASYVFMRYKTKDGNALADVAFVTTNAEFKHGLTRGELIAQSVNAARDIANTPGGDMTPTSLAQAAKKTLAGTKVKVSVLGKKDIEKLRMGAILGVSKGSTEEPKFIIMEYRGGKKDEAPLVFVGKGITFDSGGLNMKPSDGMMDMHLDMTGGATVIGALHAIAKLGLKRNVIGLVPSAENMVSGASYRPGDVLTTMLGKTVDVLNTDAEGRLVLADALTYAERYKPALVVDVATLTGAALVALGQHASAIMTKDDELADTISKLSEESGDYVWRLPLWDEYIKYTKGIHGDLANIQSSGSARYGGAINGGAFLSHFATKFPWVHIDMAPRMTAAPGDHLAKGATGEPTALLVKIAEKY